MNTYPVRSIARISVAFSSVSSGAADPTTVALTIVPPNGTEVRITDVTRDSTGAYHYDYTVSVAGVHRYKWQGDGTLIAANSYKQFRGIE